MVSPRGLYFRLQVAVQQALLFGGTSSAVPLTAVYGVKKRYPTYCNAAGWQTGFPQRGRWDISLRQSLMSALQLGRCYQLRNGRESRASAFPLGQLGMSTGNE